VKERRARRAMIAGRVRRVDRSEDIEDKMEKRREESW
jgi:hypothetical protein